jgi:hypothetical protein
MSTAWIKCCTGCLRVLRVYYTSVLYPRCSNAFRTLCTRPFITVGEAHITAVMWAELVALLAFCHNQILLTTSYPNAVIDVLSSRSKKFQDLHPTVINYQSSLQHNLTCLCEETCIHGTPCHESRRVSLNRMRFSPGAHLTPDKPRRRESKRTGTCGVHCTQLQDSVISLCSRCFCFKRTCEDPAKRKEGAALPRATP